MEKTEIVILVLVIMAGIALIILLAWKNQKDQKSLNPDAPDAVEETRMDHNRKTDRIWSIHGYLENLPKLLVIFLNTNENYSDWFWRPPETDITALTKNEPLTNKTLSGAQHQRWSLLL